MYAEDVARLVGARQERNGHWTGRCPSHDDKNPSLQISDGDSVVLVKCWAGCELEAICSALGLTLRDLRHESRSWSRGPPACQRPAPRLCKPPEATPGTNPEAEARLHRLWSESERIGKNTPAARYLQSRYLDDVVPDTLRSHNRLFCTTCKNQGIPDPYHPGLLAAVTAPDGRMVSVHRTFLTEAGRKAHGRNSKWLMPATAPGSTKGAAIRLYPHGEQLGICEGIETAMACHLLFGIPTWAAVSSGGLSCVELPPEVELVGIFADADAAGEKAAQALGRRLRLSGRRFKIWPPPNRGWDWADMLSERGNAGRSTSSTETHGVV